MKKEVVSFEGTSHQIACIGCTDKDSLGIEGLKSVYKDELFGVYQDFETPIPGFYILETRRHIQRILDFNREEQTSYNKLVFRIRNAMNDVLGIQEVTLIQEERSSHFHLWLFPHDRWMEEIKKPRVENIRSLIDYAVEYRDITQYAQDNMRLSEIYEQIIQANSKMREALNSNK